MKKLLSVLFVLSVVSVLSTGLFAGTAKAQNTNAKCQWGRVETANLYECKVTETGTNTPVDVEENAVSQPQAMTVEGCYFNAQVGKEYKCEVTAKYIGPTPSAPSCNVSSPPATGTNTCQVPACPYYALAQIKDASGPINAPGFKLRWSNTNGESGVQDFVNGQVLTDLSNLPQSFRNTRATVTLELPDGYTADDILKRECAPATSCPDVSGNGVTISNFAVGCNASYTYGWVLERVAPTPTLTPAGPAGRTEQIEWTPNANPNEALCWIAKGFDGCSVENINTTDGPFPNGVSCSNEGARALVLKNCSGSSIAVNCQHKSCDDCTNDCRESTQDWGTYSLASGKEAVCYLTGGTHSAIRDADCGQRPAPTATTAPRPTATRAPTATTAPRPTATPTPARHLGCKYVGGAKEYECGWIAGAGPNTDSCSSLGQDCVPANLPTPTATPVLPPSCYLGGLDPLGQCIILQQCPSGYECKFDTGCINPRCVATTRPGPQAADVNGDGRVNMADWTTTVQNYGASGAGAIGDVNGDGRVNAVDLSFILFNFGRTTR